MGQFFGSERIGALSHATGTITLQDSYIRIGGQGFKTGILTLVVGSPTANTLYYIYAVRSAGNTILVSSTNVNSVGPATYTSWKLVGAYYADGTASPAFGSFVNIEGKPVTDWIRYTPSYTNVNPATSKMFYRRIGEINHIKGSFSTDSVSSIIQVSMQSSVTFNTTKMFGYQGNAVDSRAAIGRAVAQNGTSGQQYTGNIIYKSSTTFGFLTETGTTAASWSTANPYSTMGGNDGISIEEFFAPVNEWANITDLKSL